MCACVCVHVGHGRVEEQVLDKGYPCGMVSARDRMDGEVPT